MFRKESYKHEFSGISEEEPLSRPYYFIMGRSENSRNRIFVETEDGIRTEAFDPAKVVDPSLIIYHPVRRVGGDLIVTNGDQTDTIRDIGVTSSAPIRARVLPCRVFRENRCPSTCPSPRPSGKP